MTTTYDIPLPFMAVEDSHGMWTVQAHKPKGSYEYVLVECSRSEADARSKAALLNDIFAGQA